jgi:hypothetical protein
LPVLTLHRLDWQLKIHAYDILDPRSMAKEYIDFEARVGVDPASSPGGITVPPAQRASFPRGYHELVRVINKPIIRFKLGKTDHILEIAREDIYETHPFQPVPPKPQSKWTASFYYSKWINDLGEFAYKKHGEVPSWLPSLSTFFPEPDDDDDAVDYAAAAADYAAAATAHRNRKPKGPRLFLLQIDQVKDILWEAMRSADGELPAPFQRVGTVQQGGDDAPVSVAV